MTVHPLSTVHDAAKIGNDVIIGPFCNVEAGVEIGDGCILDSHVTIKSGTKVGARNVFAQGSIIGGDPQDKKYRGEPTFLEIGDDNVIREYVTIHRATGEGKTTVIGNRCYLMAFVHIGHNSCLHDDVTMASYIACAGHVTIEPLVNVGGLTGIHQWTRLGRASMIGGMARITRDVPPFCMVEGENRVVDINAIGLRRVGVSPEARIALHKAVKLIFKSQLSLSHAMEIVVRDVPMTSEVTELLDFMKRLYEGKHGRGDQR